MKFLLLLVLTLALLSVDPETRPDMFCPGMQRPVKAPIESPFAPSGRFAGHWGVDFSVGPGTPVKAAGPGKVSFAGTVVGNRTVTVDHGGGLRTSYSYLAGVLVDTGDEVGVDTTLGSTGLAHGIPAVHFSVRVRSAYRDPAILFDCRDLDLSRALRLVPVPDRK